MSCSGAVTCGSAGSSAPPGPARLRVRLYGRARAALPNGGSTGIVTDTSECRARFKLTGRTVTPIRNLIPACQAQAAKACAEPERSGPASPLETNENSLSDRDSHLESFATKTDHSFAVAQWQKRHDSFVVSALDSSNKYTPQGLELLSSATTET